VEAASARGPRAGEAALGLCHTWWMLRGLLLLGATLPLVGLGGATKLNVHNGQIAYVNVGNGNRFQIYTVSPTGAHRHPLTASHRYSSYEPAYAPRGKRLVFVRAFKQSDLWTMDSDGSHKQRLTRTSGIDEVEPAWSPDGKQIAFAVERPAAAQGIWIMSVDGQGRHRLTIADDHNPSWSPDGAEIAFERDDTVTQTESIFVVPAGGGTPTKLSSDPGISDLRPAWSPDGTRILLASDRPDTLQLDLWVMNADGSNAQRVTNTPSRDEHDPAWSPDGRLIVYSGEGAFHGASSSQIYVSRADGTNRRKLTHACGECAWINDEPSWQPAQG
jgi:TolB protein